MNRSITTPRFSPIKMPGTPAGSPKKFNLNSPYHRLLNPDKNNKPPSQKYPGRNGYGPSVPLSLSPTKQAPRTPRTPRTPSKRAPHGMYHHPPHMYLGGQFPWWPREISRDHRIPLEVPSLDQGLNDASLIVHRRDQRRPIDLSHSSHLSIHQYVEVRMLNMATRRWHDWQQGIITSKIICPFFVGYNQITCYEVQIIGTTEKRQTAYCSVLSFSGEIRETRLLPHPKDFIEIGPQEVIQLLNSFYTVFAPFSPDDRGGPSVNPPKAWLPARIVSNFAHDPEPTVVFHPSFTLPYREPTATSWTRKILSRTSIPCPWPDTAHPRGRCQGTCIVDQVRVVYPYTCHSLEKICAARVAVQEIPPPCTIPSSCLRDPKPLIP